MHFHAFQSLPTIHGFQSLEFQMKALRQAVLQQHANSLHEKGRDQEQFPAKEHNQKQKLPVSMMAPLTVSSTCWTCCQAV